LRKNGQSVITLDLLPKQLTLVYKGEKGDIGILFYPDEEINVEYNLKNMINLSWRKS